MKKFSSVLIVALGFILSGTSSAPRAAQDSTSKTGCEMFPANNLSFPVNSGNHLINYEIFTQILNRVEAIYLPYFHAKGARLLIERRWDDPTVNAFATMESSNQRSVHMFGGLARHPLMTPDAFIAVACHEIGHHLGGAPLIRAGDWATSEGGADYFAMLKCMRTVLAGVDNAAVLNRMHLDGDAVRLCNVAYTDRNDITLCVRNIMAGEALAATLASLKKPSVVMPSVRTPDPTVVRRTFVAHPEAQCRLDTFVQAALCHVDPSIPLSAADIRQGSCDDSLTSRTFGQRPHCWFNPSDPRTLGSH